MGNRDRWFCDNGQCQGFIDCAIISPLGQDNPEMLTKKDNDENNDETIESSKEIINTKAAAAVAMQFSMTPPEVTDEPPPSYTDVSEKGSIKPVAVVAPYDEVADDECKKPTRKAPPVPHIPFGKSKEIRKDEGSVHSYEEIVASELNSEVSGS